MHSRSPGGYHLVGKETKQEKKCIAGPFSTVTEMRAGGG